MPNDTAAQTSEMDLDNGGRVADRLRAEIRQLREENARLQDSDLAKTEFFANMSHELRTPLNAVIGFTQVLLKGIDGPLTELQRTDLTAIYSSGQHLLALVNDIMDLSKLEVGKMELSREWLRLESIAAGVMNSAYTLIGGKDIDLVEDIPSNLPLVFADHLRIRQVILNLVSNAAKFTERGLITLRARVESPEFLIVTVEDTGIGISAEDIELLFNHFKQVGRNSQRAEGTGLGLSISKRLVEMHGGRLWVKSQFNRGSSFYFTVPTTDRVPSGTSGTGGA